MTGKLWLSAALCAALGTAVAQGVTRPVPAVNAAAESLAEADGNENVYSYCTHNEQIGGIGAGTKGHVQCAALFPGKVFEAVKGNKLTVIRVKMYNTSALKAGNQRIWIREGNLDSEPVYTEAVTFNQPKAWQEFALKTPYVVGDKDFYIGMEMEVEGYGLTDDQKKPIGISLNKRPNSLFLNVFHDGWADYSMDYGSGALMIEAVVNGETIKNDVALVKVEDVIAERNETKKVDGSLMNCTREAVNSVELTVDIEGSKKTLDVTLDKPLKQMEACDFSFEMTAPETSGKKEMTVNVSKVNGKPDGYEGNSLVKAVMDVKFVKAHRKVVLEEATGGWCPYCIQGVVAAERLMEDYPDNVICIAAHGDKPASDPLTGYGYQPLLDKAKEGYPKAVVNRKGTVFNPYYGRSNKFYGVKDLIEAELKEFTPADVKVERAALADEGRKLEVEASATFYIDSDDCPYKLAYVLLEDKLRGTQQNYMAGDTIGDPYLDRYADKPKAIRNFEFNDVARGIYAYNGVEGSLTQAIVAGETKTHEYTIDLAATNTVVADWENCRLVVMLLNEKDGSIVNANEMTLKDMDTTGIGESTSDAKVDMTVADGLLTVAAEGMALVEVFTPDGVMVAQKAFEKRTAIALSGLQGVCVARVSAGSHVTVKKFNL